MAAFQVVSVAAPYGGGSPEPENSGQNSRPGAVMGGGQQSSSHPHYETSLSTSTSTKFLCAFSASFCLIEPLTARAPTTMAEKIASL